MAHIPRYVYTSRKSSSAAGLIATVSDHQFLISTTTEFSCTIWGQRLLFGKLWSGAANNNHYESLIKNRCRCLCSSFSPPQLLRDK
ncbi:hypothetical protein HID58_002659 [Brassica napus]|uniref:Uncharacterized protein n=1 Tax=Brassica napus TaxID=3708 RepID=A0ABQ8EMY4_BRANA|nr:hypothetical protein HID58_002659 [Brassica napus]